MTPKKLREVALRLHRAAIRDVRSYNHYATELSTGAPTSCRVRAIRELDRARVIREGLVTGRPTWADPL